MHYHVIKDVRHGRNAAGEYKQTQTCACGARRTVTHHHLPGGLIDFRATMWTDGRSDHA